MYSVKGPDGENAYGPPMASCLPGYSEKYGVDTEVSHIGFIERGIGLVQGDRFLLVSVVHSQ
jgi:hypothetical protein